MGKLVVCIICFFCFACADAPAPVVQQPVPVVRPLRVVLLQDISVSAKHIPRLSAHDVDRLVAHLAAAGGALAFTTVGDGAPPLVRLSLRPPVAPSLVVTEQNAFRAARQQAALEEQRSAYEQACADFRERSAPGIQSFRGEVLGLLGQRCRVTDLRSGLERAAIFTREESVFPGAVTAVLLVSDGIDTGKGPFQLDFAEGVHVVMVCAGRDLGLLNQMSARVRVFEHPNPAVAYVLGLCGGA